MSFAKLVKEELVTIPINTQEQLSEFLAFLHMNAEIQLTNCEKHIRFKTNNPTVAKRFLQISRSLYQAELSIIKKEQQKLTKKPQLIIDIKTKVKEILEETKMLDTIYEAYESIVIDEPCQVAFLRASFLATGSVNHPKPHNII